MIPPIASRFVAAETATESLDYVAELNRDGIGGILNLLGEHYQTREAADEDVSAYLDLVEQVGRTELTACLSVKPSQIGLDAGDDVFRENLGRILERADEQGVFVWVDMEDHTTTDVTLDAYTEFATEYDGGVGLCVQANLKRTAEDLPRLADVPGKVRLVKGAYDEPPEVAYQQKKHVNEAYRQYLEYMFEAFDGGIAVGSHDPEMIDYARELHEEYGTDFEIQMLMGVRTDAQRELAQQGYEVNQYIPYGDKWMSYFYRRIRERKENLVFAARAVLTS
ncbi:L-proline dehydrogenase [Halogranum amylolyticum]|uniref:proline dehydrogenase n=1 Tax=Halogranum amylolyticum TaxID=660520 RepID=A0A1H8WJJ5_9EURY|nr:proline dehydrogenase family protein [Halogranum amylolyticum]SEP27811.1 L-proline dehydrogenase [Halogranum amylolyticum]